MVQSFCITQVMRLSDLKPLLPIEFNLLGKSQKFNNGIMYPWSNPADYASRGLYVTNLEKIHRWFSVHPFSGQKTNCQSSGNINPVSKKDPELKKQVRVNFTVIDDTIISRIGLLTIRRLKLKKIME